MILTSTLLIISFIHIYWIFGEIGIAQALPSDEKGERLLNPSRLMTLMMALVLFGFAWVSYRLDMENHSLWINKAGWGLAILFFLRAIGDFKMVGVFKKIKQTEFAKYDNWVYIPLCLMISFLFVLKLMA